MDLFEEFEEMIKNDCENYSSESKREILDKLQDIIDAMANDNKAKHEHEDVLVPIKSTILNFMEKYNVSYGELSITLLRKYYIALLNLGYIDLEDLSDMVEKFVSKIDKIEYCSIAPTIYGGGVEIDGKTMFISTDLSNGMTDENYEQLQLMEDNGIFDEDEFDSDDEIDFEKARFEIEFYKAVTSVIIDSNKSNLKGLSYIICEMIAEKVWFMDEKGTLIIMPRAIPETINDTTITTRTGYLRCNLPISLFKQFCIAYEINDNIFFNKMFYSSFKEILEEVCNGEMKVFLFMLDKHFDMYAMRTINNAPVDSELSLVETFQTQLCKKMNKSTKGYPAFFSFVTTDDLRKNLQKDFDDALD